MFSCPQYHFTPSSSPFSLCSFSYPSPSLPPSLSITYFPLFGHVSSLSPHRPFPLAPSLFQLFRHHSLCFLHLLPSFDIPPPSLNLPLPHFSFKLNIESGSRCVEKVLTSLLPLATPLAISVSLLFLSAFLPSSKSDHRSHIIHTLFNILYVHIVTV